MEQAQITGIWTLIPEQLVQRLAYIDPLTGLSNRRYAMEQMHRWVQEGTGFLISFIDIDHLKYCNDTFGHDSGDRYLLNVSSVLKLMPGELCRIGGDEFLLLMPGSDAKEQDIRLAELRELLQEQTGVSYPQSFSFATSAVPAYPDASLGEYLQETDEKMYQYKREHKKKLL